MASETKIFDQAPIERGDHDGVMTSSDLLDGWRTYWDRYDANPDVCRCTVRTVEDMYLDTVIRDMIVTEETIYMTPSVAPELNLALFKERKSEDAFGLIMGMEIVIDSDSDRTELLMHEREHDISNRAVVVRG